MSDWNHDMQAAPHDGTRVWVWGDRYTPEDDIEWIEGVYAGYFYRQLDWIEDRTLREIKPFAWQPITDRQRPPEPPTETPPTTKESEYD